MSTALTRLSLKYSDDPSSTILTDAAIGGSQALVPGEVVLGIKSNDAGLFFLDDAGNVKFLRQLDLSLSSPVVGNFLRYNGTSWVNTVLQLSDIPDLSATYATSAQGTLADAAVQPGDNVSTLTNDSSFIPSNPAGVSGADTITNIISLTEAEYLSITPDASTLYVIV